MMEKSKGTSPSPLNEGECSDGKAKETFPFTHTPFSRCTYPAVAGYLQWGNCSDGKGECGDGKSIEGFPKEWGCSDVFFCLSIIENELFAIFG